MEMFCLVYFQKWLYIYDPQENDFNVKVFLPGGDHDVDTTKPWLERNKKTNPNKSKHQSYEEGLLTNMWYDLDTLVCFLIIKGKFSS